MVLQGYYISKQYLEYNTITQVNVEADEILTPPAIVVCFNFREIVNENENKTAREIFSATPNNATILNKVWKNSNSSYDIKLGTIEDMIITRGTRQSMLCYSLMLKDGVNLKKTLDYK